MATVKFYVRGKSNPSKIGIRFMLDGKTDYRRTTPLQINPRYFDNKTGKVKRKAEYTEKDVMINRLADLENFIRTEYNTAQVNKVIVSAQWLKDKLDVFFGITEKEQVNKSLLLEYANTYIDNIKIKTNDKTGKLGLSESSIKKYKTIRNKIEAFEKHKRKKYHLIDIDLNFRNDFLKWMLEVDKLSRNTAGRYVKALKTICNDAKRSGLEVSPQLEQIKGFTVKIDKVYLDTKELQKIHHTPQDTPELENAKDWLIIGCNIGQRGGDLLRLTTDNIEVIEGIDCIALEQQKTGKKVAIPISEEVREILDKRGGNFPDPYTGKEQSNLAHFNKDIKKVALKSGITEVMTGTKKDPETNRNKTSEYHKWELITSHICRRSFATNRYGEMPTPYIMSVTAHSSERDFLDYIGKTSTDNVKEVAHYFKKYTEKAKAETKLRIAK